MMSPSETTELMKNLKRLSEVDEQLTTLRSNKTSLEKEIRSIEKELKSCRDKIDEKLQKIKDETHQEHKDEVLLGESEQELEKVQAQLNAAKTNEELRIFKKKRVEIANRISELEDAVLVHLSDLDRSREEVEVEKKNLSARDAEAKQETAALREKIAGCEAEIRLKQEERKETASTVPGEILHKYERVLAKEKRRPVVEVKNRTCQGCFMRVTLQEINRIWQGGDIVLCRHCSRILCLHEDEMQE